MEKRVLVVVTDNCGPIETVTVAETLSRFGAKVTIASIHPDDNLTCQMNYGIKIQADITIKSALNDDWDLIAIPGCENSSRPLNECMDLINLITELRSKGKLLACVHQNFFRDDNDDPTSPENNGQSHRVGDGGCVLQGPGMALKAAIELGGALYTKDKAEIVAAKMSVVDDMSGLFKSNFTEVKQLINENKTLLMELKKDITDHTESKHSEEPSVASKKKNNSKANAKLNEYRKQGGKRKNPTETVDDSSSDDAQGRASSGRVINTPSKIRNKNSASTFHFFDILWPFLKQSNWTMEKGTRPNDRFFFPPGIHKGKKIGNRVAKNRKDYFDSRMQVINFCLVSEEWKTKTAPYIEQMKSMN